MKYSKYNIRFSIDDNIVLFNSLTTSFLVLDTVLNELLDTHKDCCTKIRDIHPDFYDTMVQQGFIIEATIDENQAAEKMLFSYINNHETYHLTINPTMDCNFKCWYCYENHHKGSMMSHEILNRTFLLIDKIAGNENLKRFHIYFFGGEPFLYYDSIVKSVLDRFSLVCENKLFDKTIQFTTNGILINDRILEELVRYGVSSFQITLDGHKKTHNKSRFSATHRDSYTPIVNNIRRIINRGLHVTLRINYTRHNISEISKIVDEFSDLSAVEKSLILFTPTRVWQDNPYKCITKRLDEIIVDTEQERTVKYYEDELTTKIISMGFKYFAVYMSDYVRHTCRCNLVNSAHINYDGSVYKCAARKFAPENVEGELFADGTIGWNERSKIRFGSRLNNAPCRECVIFPMCGGGCSQMLYEYGNIAYCMYKYDEYSKIDFIKEYLLQEDFLLPL